MSSIMVERPVSLSLYSPPSSPSPPFSPIRRRRLFAPQCHRIRQPYLFFPPSSKRNVSSSLPLLNSSHRSAFEGVSSSSSSAFAPSPSPVSRRTIRSILKHNPRYSKNKIPPTTTATTTDVSPFPSLHQRSILPSQFEPITRAVSPSSSSNSSSYSKKRDLYHHDGDYCFPNCIDNSDNDSSQHPMKKRRCINQQNSSPSQELSVDESINSEESSSSITTRTTTTDGVADEYAEQPLVRCVSFDEDDIDTTNYNKVVARVRFQPKVGTKLIPCRHSYLQCEKRMMWVPLKQLGYNAKRNKIEYKYDNWDLEQATEEDQMDIDPRTGSYVHPVHSFLRRYYKERD